MAPLEEMHQMRPKTRCTVNCCRNDQIQRNRWSTVSKISQCGYIQRDILLFIGLQRSKKKLIFLFLKSVFTEEHNFECKLELNI